MTKRIILATAAAMLPGLALAHPGDHGSLAFSALGGHLASDPFHLLTLGGVIGAGLVSIGAASLLRTARARRRPARRH